MSFDNNHLGITSDLPRNMQGKIYFYDVIDRQTKACNLSDQLLQQVATREYTNKYFLEPRPEKLVDFQINHDRGIDRLEWETRRGKYWQPTPLSIQAEEVFANF